MKQSEREDNKQSRPISRFGKREEWRLIQCKEEEQEQSAIRWQLVE